MQLSLNQILLIGRAGNEPEMQYTPNGNTAVTSFSLAVNNPRRGQNGEWTEETEWFRVTAWERQAESVNQYLSKGRRVFVEGRLSTRQYTSNSGEARTSLEVRAFKVVFLDSPSGESTPEGVPTEAQSRTSPSSGSQEPDKNNSEENTDVEELPW
jgi:single-strand DNA-binding protein